MFDSTSMTSLGPRFSARRVLGEGGSGIVYEVDVASPAGAARQTILHELRDGSDSSSTIALKVLRPELAASERERSRFLLEAERMQRVSHPALVRLLEAGFLPDGRPYLAMPLLDGETLASRTARRSLPLETALRFFDAIARGVHTLHASGLVHRDESNLPTAALGVLCVHD